MPQLGPTSGNHVNLSVSDLERSADWYCRVFGLVVVGDEQSVPAATDRPLRYRSLVDPSTLSYIVGLIEHGDRSRDPFDERSTGLDHFGLHVAEASDLEDWARHLDELGVEHSGIKTVPYGSAITLRDPDNIQLEIQCPDVGFWAPRFIEASERDSSAG